MTSWEWPTAWNWRSIACTIEYWKMQPSRRLPQPLPRETGRLRKSALLYFPPDLKNSRKPQSTRFTKNERVLSCFALPLDTFGKRSLLLVLLQFAIEFRDDSCQFLRIPGLKRLAPDAVPVFPFPLIFGHDDPPQRSRPQSYNTDVNAVTVLNRTMPPGTAIESIFAIGVIRGSQLSGVARHRTVNRRNEERNRTRLGGFGNPPQDSSDDSPVAACAQSR